MKIRTALLCAFGLLFLTACGTPTEIKTLSTAQIGYFDTAVKAVTTQSEALLLAAEEIQKQAKARIEEREQQNQADLKKLLLEQSKSSSQEQEQVVDATLKSVAQSASTAQNAISNLDKSLAAIKTRSTQLEAYIAKMKEVQTTLDAYIQSEKAGEAILKDVLKQPSVGSMVSSVPDESKKVTETVSSFSNLLTALK